MTRTQQFRPDWVSPPGHTISDILMSRSKSSYDFAEELKFTHERTMQILEGRAEVTLDVAQELARVLGSSAKFWINREIQYRQDLARNMSSQASDNWLDELPVRDMIKFGWIYAARTYAEKVKECLRFFNVADVASWRKTYNKTLEIAAFRTSNSFDTKPGAVAAWLRRAEIESTAIEASHWDAERFGAALLKIRALTRSKDSSVFIEKLQKYCAECGVIVVILRAPDGCRASGATRFLPSGKALLQLSFRYLSDDHFWFTFFHEAGHLLLHSKSAVFLEGSGMSSNKYEIEANQFAAKTLIPLEYEKELLTLAANAKTIIRFSRKIGVSPGIVVGQLQHRGNLRVNQLNSLKRRYKWLSRK